jgi:Carboxypeptidase regulatory-like domain/TonB dependent receptor
MRIKPGKTRSSRSEETVKKIAALLIGIPVFVCALSSRPVCAQQFYGTISGTVTDPTGAAVPNAAVKVTNIDTNVTATLKTTNAGVYVANNLVVGTYRVEAEAAGFKRAVAERISLDVGAAPKVDLALAVGQASESVTVTEANAPILQTRQADLGQTVDSSELMNLPIEAGTYGSGRSPYSLLPLAAGVSQQTGCTGGGTGGGGLGSCGNEGNVRISGSRPRTDDNVLDGVSITPIVFGGQAVQPSVEAIQEFRIEQNSMSAEYGKAGGLIVIQVSKSGTNQFHGSAYLYNRNENWDARDFFADPTLRKNPYNYDDFGGSIGGPIVKGKLFFFSDYEAVRNHGSTVNHGVIVPNSLFRSGDLGTLCTGNGGTFNGSGICSNAADQINDPNSGNPIPFNNIAACAGTTCSPISSASLAILALWPNGGTPSGVGANVLTLNPAYTNSDNLFNPRVDWNLSQADHIFGAFHGEYGSGINGDIILGPAGQALSRGRNYATTEGWTHAITTTMLNEFRFGVSHHTGDRMTFGAGTVSPSGLGLTGVPNCLSSIPDTANGTKCGTPGVSVFGYTSFQNGGMLYEPATALHFSDTVSKLVGKHSLKWGFQADHYSIDNYQPNDVTGNFPFDGSAAGNPFADYLFGIPNKSTKLQGQPAFVSSRAWAYAFFLQDDIKITPKLTLNAGLRWQYDQSFHETHHGDAFFDPCATLYTGRNPNCVPHWDQFGVGGTPDTSFDPSKHQFEPRIGLAWNPVGGFVVRAGYGIMHPGFVGHGRAGDGQPGPQLLWSSSLSGQWDTATPSCPIPTVADITATIPINGCTVSFASWAPRKQYPTYSQLWNFTVQKQLGNDTTAQIGYVGSRGVHLPINYAYNICQQSPASTAALATPTNSTFDFVGPLSTPYCPAAAAALNAGAGFSPGPVYFWLTINPGWWGLSSSIYHSMQAQFDHRFSHNFSLLANFTWSKLIDDSSSDWGGFWSLDALGQDFYNRKAERSVSAGDIPFRFTMAPVVQLPFGPGQKWLNSGVASDVFGGWRISTIYTISAGTPFGITDNSYGFCNGAGVLEDRPNVIGNVASISGSRRSVNLWFNNQALDFAGTCPGGGLVNSAPAADFCCDLTKAFGNAPRFFSNVRAPGVDNLDFSIQKDFKIPAGEQTKLTFEAAVFNLPNHPQFAEPVADPTLGYFAPTATQHAAGFGAISGTSFYSNRVIQLGLHLYF